MNRLVQRKDGRKKGGHWFHPVLLTAIFAPIILVALYGSYVERKWGIFITLLVLGIAFLAMTHAVFHMRRKRVSSEQGKGQKLYQ